MYLHRIHLDPRCREVRRDLSDPYQLHSTLCRAFCTSEQKCPQGEVLWRFESKRTPNEEWPQVLVQSRSAANWAGINIKGWLANADPPIDLQERLKLNSLKNGQSFRFRLRANPCVTRNGKRLGLVCLEEQEQWMVRKGALHGFSLPSLPTFNLSEAQHERVDLRISQEQILRAKQHTGNGIRIFSVLYEGILTVTESKKFSDTIQRGIGHGKVLGLGLLSVAPIA